ncbi:hypothetical protein GQ55_3G156700 [Panicum hallii var. hallii]|uniref:Uncharacterized protein n=1 Tax=Panicum hallii var. hallii TaxID=1504633 RepID=A0A2T7E9X7_9POAL|nr:hypothetical protein GQ55_3G156700 [Panicum hallii var. hallii]
MQEDNGHATHGWINIIADSCHRPRVRIPTKHLSILEWKEIKAWPAGDPDTVEFLIQDCISVRCQHCKMRLVDDSGKYCTLECSLDWQNQRRLIPRALQLKALQTDVTIEAYGKS